MRCVVIGHDMIYPFPLPIARIQNCLIGEIAIQSCLVSGSHCCFILMITKEIQITMKELALLGD